MNNFKYKILLILKGKLKKLWFINKLSKKNYIDISAVVIGVKNVSIGIKTVISEGVWLNVNHRINDDIKIIIGNYCHIGKNNFITSGPLIEIKDFCFTGLNCQLLGCSHNIANPNTPYTQSGLTNGKSITLGVNTWLTNSVTVLEGVKIGHGSIIGASSLVLEDIPPFSIAFGNPCKVIKRYDFKLNKWTSIENWNEELEFLIPHEDIYLKDLLNNCNIFNYLISYNASSRKFGWV